ncbi:hypothetical protein GF323_03640 [Candidatus Woesearchaeota archaeon]|nr:hypothetical protein [Candidatus Woesearchaeota archaeon]
MKKIGLFLLLILMPFAYALKTGVVIDDGAKIYKGCVDINSQDSAYDVLKAFDSQRDELKLTIDGGTLGTPAFLRAVNGKEGGCADNDINNCLKWRGWNFWIADNDNHFTEPPELSPGWGMAISDYKVEAQDVIGINFAITEYNADFSTKSKPEKPDYIKYDGLCNKLKIKEIDIEVDGDNEHIDEQGGEIEVKSGSEIEIEIELKNLYEDIEIEDVYIKAEIEDIDAGEDLTKDTGEEYILPQRDETFRLGFNLPQILEDDEYELLINIFGVDEYNLEYFEELNYDIEVDKESHEIVLDDIEFKKDIGCRQTALITITIANIGENDEEIDITVSESGKIYETDTFFLEESDKTQKYYTLDINEPGNHVIRIEAEYSGKAIYESIIIEKEKCDKKEQNAVSLEQTDEKDHKEEIQLEFTDTRNRNTAQTKTRGSILPYVLLVLFLIGIATALLVIITLSR